MSGDDGALGSGAGPSFSTMPLLIKPAAEPGGSLAVWTRERVAEALVRMVDPVSDSSKYKVPAGRHAAGHASRRDAVPIDALFRLDW